MNKTGHTVNTFSNSYRSSSVICHYV